MVRALCAFWELLNLAFLTVLVLLVIGNWVRLVWMGDLATKIHTVKGIFAAGSTPSACPKVERLVIVSNWNIGNLWICGHSFTCLGGPSGLLAGSLWNGCWCTATLAMVTRCHEIGCVLGTWEDRWHT